LEISGEQRRLLPDLGYWYAPDGRTAEQQAFLNKLKLNLKPLNGYLQPFGRKFRVSLDNLTGEGGDGALFKDNVLIKYNVFFR
jgi:elongation factor P hydroxylase